MSSNSDTGCAKIVGTLAGLASIVGVIIAFFAWIMPFHPTGSSPIARQQPTTQPAGVTQAEPRTVVIVVTATGQPTAEPIIVPSTPVLSTPMPSLTSTSPPPTRIPPTLTRVPEVPTRPQSAIQPSSFTVYANRAWNDSGLNVGAGDTVQVQYKSGTWAYWAGTIPATDARGNPSYVCAQIQPASKCLEPVPEAAAGSLIARIGDAKPFYIGNQFTFKAASAGMLQLGMNDLDLSGNEGFVVVQITLTKNQ
jgi:hypothetical protein